MHTSHFCPQDWQNLCVIKHSTAQMIVRQMFQVQQRTSDETQSMSAGEGTTANAMTILAGKKRNDDCLEAAPDKSESGF